MAWGNPKGMGPLFIPREGCKKWGPEEMGTLAGPGAEPAHPGPQDRPLPRGGRGEVVGSALRLPDTSD